MARDLHIAFLVEPEPPTLGRPSEGSGWDRYDPGCRWYSAGGLPNWDGRGEQHVPGSSTEDISRAILYQRGGFPGQSGGGGGGGGGGSQAKPLTPESAQEDQPKPTDWLEIRLIDNEGNAVPNAKYKVKLADGSTKEGTLDGSGCAYLDGVARGQCEVTFPDLLGKG